ncbi:hypothetical protein ES703_72731 [subsurface metagenome]
MYLDVAAVEPRSIGSEAYTFIRKVARSGRVIDQGIQGVPQANPDAIWVYSLSFTIIGHVKPNFPAILAIEATHRHEVCIVVISIRWVWLWASVFVGEHDFRNLCGMEVPLVEVVIADVVEIDIPLTYLISG